MAIKFIRRMKTFNRRQFVRVRINCIVKFKVNNSGKEVGRLTNLVDLSEGGIKVNTFDDRLAPKTQVHLEFQLPGVERSVVAKGDVVRSYQKRKGSYQAGVLFKEISREDIEIIKSYISARKKK